MRLKSVLVDVLRCLAIIALIPGCSWIATYESGEIIGSNYQCKTWIVNCNKTPHRPQPVVKNPQPSGDCYAVQPKVDSSTPWAGFAASNPAYCDQPWKVSKIRMPELRGAVRIMTSQAHNEINQKDFLKFTWAPETEALYVAYDSRAGKKPDWLAPPDYRKVTDSSQNPLYIEFPRPDAPGDIKLEIFERIFLSEPTADQVVTLPSNLYGNPGNWSQTTPQRSAMYMVILRPKPDLDCANPTAKQRTEQVITEGCFSSEPLATLYANSECRDKRAAGALTEQACAEPVCVEKGSCTGDDVITEMIGRRTFSSWSFLRSSEIEFLPATSTAEIAVDGSKYSLGAKGSLYFDYVLDDFARLQSFELEAMHLELGTLNAPIGAFADIEVGLAQPTIAHCVDSNPPYAAPCDRYRIHARTFVTEKSAIHDGKPMVLVASNTGALDVVIDHPKRSFTIKGGPLKATLEVNGRDRDVLTSIDLTGNFKNFEPHAVAGESTRSVECGVGDTLVPSNLKEVHLDSAGSFDIYDSLAGASFDWYEDFGLITERSWGQGPKVTIPPYQLSFGTHEMTLVLRDSVGAINTDTFEVEVRDSTPPTLSVPPDRYYLMTRPGGPVHIDLGKASASDTCEPNVATHNDAPAGSLFPPGLTRVTWTADDGGGNTTTAVQNVFVFQTPDVGEPIHVIEGWAGLLEQLSATAAKSMETLEACAPGRVCEVGFGTLSEQLLAMEGALAEVEVDETAEATREGVLDGLRGVRAKLLEADRAMARAGAAAGEASEARSAALEAASASDTTLLEIVEMLRTMADDEDP